MSSTQLVTEKDDHVSSLQQQLAQLKHTLLVTQETLRKERDENDGLQSQLATVCDQLATLKSKEEELQHELSMRKEKDIEHETSSVLVEIPTCTALNGAHELQEVSVRVCVCVCVQWRI